MDVLHERCAGLDISKKDAKACVRTPRTKRRGSFTTETTTWGSTTNAVLALRDHLLAAEVTLVVIEATSDYWKPFYYLLVEDLDVILVNARQVKNLPGRKTDVPSMSPVSCCTIARSAALYRANGAGRSAEGLPATSSSPRPRPYSVYPYTCAG